VITGRFFTRANIISLARVPLAAAACYFLRAGNTGYTVLFVVLAIVSDAVDGELARRTGTVSDWGKILDPVADKTAFVIFGVTLFSAGLLPLWVLVVTAGRDLLIVAGGLLFYRKKKPPSSNVWGKLATVFLSLYMLRQAAFPALQFPEADWLFSTDALGLLSMVLVVLSFATYVHAAACQGEEPDATKKA
jgi:CDP-diacylglycerol--glycerol-3-phosphate 3-phosphatidyltransferase